MTRLVLVVLVAASLLGAGAAQAEPNLRLEREPPPRNLRMRPRAALVTASPARRPTPMPAAPAARGTDPAPIVGLDGVRDVRSPLSFSLTMGYQIDGARPSGRASLDGRAPVPGRDYETLRSYGFGEAFVSTRGVGLPSLSSYFALRFQAAEQLEVDRDLLAPDELPPDNRDIPLAPPIATWFDRSGGELRTGWGELVDFLPKRWGLSRLRVRAGDQFIYGPWVVHMLGANVAYEGPTVTTAVYWGVRRSDYTRALENRQPSVAGASLRFDLRGLTSAVPIALTAEYFALGSYLDQPATRSTQISADWRPKRDIAVIGQVRTLDGNLANQRLEVRTRFREVHNFVFDVMRRREDDWRWDPTLTTRDRYDQTEARRYLDLGPPRPQLLASIRAGTLIAENVDLLARVAVSTDQSAEDEAIQSYSASYVEMGGALEVRLRRTVAFGASVLSRATERITDEQIVDQRNVIEPLPSSAAMGEENFVEAGTNLRLTIGARRFSALLELYGRRTRYAPAYVDPLLPLEEFDVRGGGRFAIDAWVGRRIRIYASYDVSSTFDNEPQITGYKSLRLTLTGVY